MSNQNNLEFEKNKNSKQNIDIFLKYIKTKNKPWSTILKNTLMLDISEDDFRQKIKAEVLSYLEKDK